MSVTAASFLADKRVQEFAAVDPLVIQAWLDSCKTELNADAWGSKYDEGLIFLTAHSMVRAGVLTGSNTSAQPVGPVASVTVGPVSRSYAVSAAASGSGQSDLDMTTYGQIFKRKRAALIRTPVVM